MEHLPWLVVYGPFVWMGLLAASLVMAVVSVFTLRARRIRRQSSGRAASLGVPIRNVHGVAQDASVVIEGVLHARGLPSERIDDGGAAAALTVTSRAIGRGEASVFVRAEALSVTLDDGSVELEGPVRVISGSREYCPFWPLRGAQRQRLAALVTADPDRTRYSITARSVADGERVRVAGRLRAVPVADDGTGDERQAAVRWSLSGAHEVHLAAVEPPRVVAPPWWHAVPRAVAVTLAFLGISAVVGHNARSAAQAAQLEEAQARQAAYSGTLPGGRGQVEAIARHDRQHLFLSSLHPLAIQAAIPFVRGEALESMQLRLFHAALSIPEQANALLALLSLDPEQCAGRTLVFHRYRMYDEAIRVAASCREPEARWIKAVSGDAWLAIGELANASRDYGVNVILDISTGQPNLSEPYKRFAFVHLNALNWEAAKSVMVALESWGVDAKVSELTAGEPFVLELAGPGEYLTPMGKFERAKQCLIDAAALRMGDEGARKDIVKTSKSRDGALAMLCNLVLADLSHGPERIGLIGNKEPDVGAASPVLQEIRALLIAEVDPTLLEPSLLTWLRDPSRDMDIGLLVLDRSGVAGGIAGTIPHLGLRRAVLDLLVRQPSPTGPVREFRAHLASLMAIVEILIDKPEEARRWADMAVADLENVVAAGSAIDRASIALDATRGAPASEGAPGGGGTAGSLPGARMSATSKLEEARTLQAIVAYRAGDAEQARQMLSHVAPGTRGSEQLEAALALRLDGHVASLWQQPEWESAEERNVIADAANGDGTQVVDILYPVLCAWPLYLGAVGPRIREGRERIVEFLSWCPGDRGIQLRRERIWISRMLGDEETYRREKERAERIYHAMMQREPSVLIELLGTLVTYSPWLHHEK